MISLNGKTAIVTGPGRGIGRATAISLAKEGVHLGLFGINMSNLKKVAAELAQFEVTVSIASADVTDLESRIKCQISLSIFSLYSGS
ncbi:SDR family NAD(P)-dependent oxidoreductase [Sutcliffiella cohnii]